MFGMSIADIIASVCMALASVPMPSYLPREEEFGYDWAGARLGNSATCTAQGFLVTFGSTCMLTYNLMLCVYYFCAIYLNMSERKIKKRVEPFLHVFPVVICLVLASIPIPFQLYNPSMIAMAWCGPLPYPYECYLYPNEIECIRGDPKLMKLTYLTISTCSALLISLIVILLSLVIKNIIQMDRMLRQLSDQCQTTNSALARLQEALNFQRNSKAAIVQAVSYISTVLLSVLPTFLLSSGAVTVFGSERQQKLGDVFERILLVLLPLQGFFNCIIFVSHKVYNYRRVHESVSICQVLGLLLFKSSHDPTFISRISIVSHQEIAAREEFLDRDGFVNDNRDDNNNDVYETIYDVEINDEDNTQKHFRLNLLHQSKSSFDHRVVDNSDTVGIKDGEAMQGSKQQDERNAQSPTSKSNATPVIGYLSDLSNDSMLSFPSSRSSITTGMALSVARGINLGDSVVSQKEETTRKYYLS